MLTLDLLTHPNAEKLSSNLKPYIKGTERLRFTLNWAGLLEEGVPVTIESWRLNPNAKWSGIHRDGEITIRTFGKKNNLYLHRGGIMGTIYHEFFHYLQWYGCIADIGNWFWDVHNEEQEKLFQTWRENLEGFHAGSAAWEVSAEVYRVISGYTSAETWEKNQALKEDYLNFFKNNDMIKHFI